MRFTCKMQAKEQIRGRYLSMTVALVVQLLLKLFAASAAIAGAAGFVYRWEEKNAWQKMGELALLLLLLLFSRIPKWVYQVFLMQKYGAPAENAEQSRSFAQAVLHVLAAKLLIGCKKICFLPVFFSPALLCLCLTVLFRQAGLLYWSNLLILLSTAILLFVIGGFFYFAANARFLATEYAVLYCEDAPLREIITAEQKLEIQWLGKLFFYRLTMIPWYFVAILPLGIFYALPYLFQCRLCVCRAVFESAGIEAQEARVKIYAGKGAPAQSVREY